MTYIPGGLSAATDPSLGTFTAGQNQAILIVGLACSCVSLLATLITLRWFILMKRLFRHRLVLYLILSDTFKALWYFVFPIVIFTRGPVQSSSAWCQISGFLLSFGIEASDFAILLIALHAMLYIFRPPVRIGKGGLYKYRKWLPIVWLGPPALSASLAFINHGQGYVTTGTFCYLPKRPIWYRLALAYIPRYIILITILGMYTAITIYVHIKFRGFKAVVAGESDSNYAYDLERSESLTEDSIAPDEITAADGSTSLSVVEKQAPATILRPSFPRVHSYKSPQNSTSQHQNQHQEPWDSMNFVTSKHLHDSTMGSLGVQAADFAPPLPTAARDSASSEETRVAGQDPSTQLQNFTLESHKARQPSEVPSTQTTRTEDTRTTGPTGRIARRKPKEIIIKDPLQRARSAIKQQLRFLFMYPAVYTLMWTFPFVQNCLLYSDYFASHPVFWLQVVSTAALSLQAAADCLIFSWREKPWRRVDQNSKLSVPFWRDQSVVLIKRMSFNGSALFSPRRLSRKDTNASEQSPRTQSPPTKTASPTWWEAEGRKRKDSVWMGTDLMSKITGKQPENSMPAEMETIEERNGSV